MRINPYNRGVAIVGNQLFMGTLDAAQSRSTSRPDICSGKRRSPTPWPATA